MIGSSENSLHLASVANSVLGEAWGAEVLTYLLPEITSDGQPRISRIRLPAVRAGGNLHGLRPKTCCRSSLRLSGACACMNARQVEGLSN